MYVCIYYQCISCNVYFPCSLWLNILVNLSLNNEHVTKPVLVKRKGNVTGSVSFGRQIGFQFTVFNTSRYSVYSTNPVVIIRLITHLLRQEIMF